jgi:UDP-N-acetylglucosamine transferase subunit ALG13
MKYIVTARHWITNAYVLESSKDGWNFASHEARFVTRGSEHELTDNEVVELIMKFGRAEITEENGIRKMEFQNDYD